MNWAPELVTGLKDLAIVVFLGYGLKLLKQQNDLLKAEKALKDSEINVHKATIEHLKNFQAPAIARDLEQMTKTANALSEKNRELKAQVSQTAEDGKDLADTSRRLGMATAFLEAVLST